MRAAFFCLCSLISVCVEGQKEEVPYVILLSFDGFRFDYVELFNPPYFQQFITQGSRSRGLIPSFPSKTFPNHYTLVTGLYPGHHGLVDNAFYDPSRKIHYSMKTKETVRDSYYYSGKPLWQLASEKGIKSASFFWVGSEVPLHPPDYVVPYEQSVPDTVRVDHVLSWLSLPDNERPHFITLYFSTPDHEGHLYGPHAEETRRAVIHADSLLSRLMTGIGKTKLPVNVIVVSDHGMKGLKQVENSYIFLDEILNHQDSSLKLSNGGTQVHLYQRNIAKRDSLYTVLKSQATKFSVLKPQEFPSHWNYKSERAGDILLVAHDGYYFRDRDRKELASSLKSDAWFGVHGYSAADVPEMKGIFYAQGPNIKKGIVLEPFENVHVFPLIAKILQLPLPVIDGKFDVLKKLYIPSVKKTVKRKQ